MDAGGESSSSRSSSHPSSTVKRKYHELVDGECSVLPTSSSPPPLSPLAAPTLEERQSEPVSATLHDAHKTLIARSAPHVLGRMPTPSGTRTPSIAASSRSSPTSDEGRSTPDHILSPFPASNSQSHHVLPPGYRGPVLRRDDAEDIAPPPHLLPTPGSSTLFTITNFALNRNGWRYTAAGPSSQALPRTLFKTLETAPADVHWCWADRSPFTKYSPDAATVCSDKGFRSARTNIGVRSGEYYAEIEILPPEQLVAGVGAPGPIPAPMKDGAHVRVGWARREAQINAPVGFDGYSYGFRGRTGDKVTLSRPLPYGKPFKAGDVVGLYIKLPPLRAPLDDNDPANIRRERIAIRYRAQLLFESLEYPKTREMEQLMERSRKGNSIEEAYKGIEGTGVFAPHDPVATSEHHLGNASVNGVSTGGTSTKVKNRKNPGTKEKPSGPSKPSLRPVPKLTGSKIGFFVNGEPQGIAFRDVFDFRPLRVKGFAETKLNPVVSGSGKTKTSSSRKGDSNVPVISVKTRENVFDDGTLGYYPFASMYGGARARLVTDETHFRFCPPDDIEAALEAVSTLPDAKTEIAIEKMHRRTWKPLSARFDEHLAEMWEYDLQDEARAQAAASKEEIEKEKRNLAAKERYATKKAQLLAYEEEKRIAEALQWDQSRSPGMTPDETPASPPLEFEMTMSASSTPARQSPFLEQSQDEMLVDGDEVLAHRSGPDLAQQNPRQSSITVEIKRPAAPLIAPDIDMSDAVHEQHTLFAITK